MTVQFRVRVGCDAHGGCDRYLESVWSVPPNETVQRLVEELLDAAERESGWSGLRLSGETPLAWCPDHRPIA